MKRVCKGFAERLHGLCEGFAKSLKSFAKGLYANKSHLGYNFHKNSSERFYSALVVSTIGRLLLIVIPHENSERDAGEILTIKKCLPEERERT